MDISAPPIIEWFLRPDALFGDLFPRMIDQIWWSNTSITPIVLIALSKAQNQEEAAVRGNDQYIYSAAQTALAETFGKPNAPIFIADTTDNKITGLSTWSREQQMRMGKRIEGGVSERGLPIAIDQLFLEALGKNAFWRR